MCVHGRLFRDNIAIFSLQSCLLECCKFRSKRQSPEWQSSDSEKEAVVGHEQFIIKNGPIPASFCLFSFFSCYDFNKNWKKRRWCAWDSNLGPQDGRCRQNHRAMAATPWAIYYQHQFINSASMSVQLVDFLDKSFCPLSNQLEGSLGKRSCLHFYSAIDLLSIVSLLQCLFS